MATATVAITPHRQSSGLDGLADVFDGADDTLSVLAVAEVAASEDSVFAGGSEDEVLLPSGDLWSVE